MRATVRRALVPALAVLLTAGCTSSGDDEDRGGAPRVAVAAYPFAWLVQEVGGDAVELVDLLPSGVGPHDLELGPEQVALARGADLVVSLRGFQPALDDAVGQGERVLDLATVVEQRAASSDLGDEEGGLDPHVWLDPVRLADAAEAVGARLEELAPGSAARARTTADALRALHVRYQDALAGCERRHLVTSHTAFGYLAERYDLQQVGVSGTAPDAAPSSGRVAEVVRFARAAGVRTVFVTPGETEPAQEVARALAATTAPLLTFETAPEDGDLLSGMQADLAAVAAGLSCT